jgi:chromosome segregation ATPase
MNEAQSEQTSGYDIPYGQLPARYEELRCALSDARDERDDWENKALKARECIVDVETDNQRLERERDALLEAAQAYLKAEDDAKRSLTSGDWYASERRRELALAALRAAIAKATGETA